MNGSRDDGNENRPNEAGRELGHGNGRRGRKAAIAIALAAAFAVGAFAGYGASSLGIWRHNDRLLDEREATEARQQERYNAIQSVDGMTLDEADDILKSYHVEYVCVRSKKSTVPTAWQGDTSYFNDTFNPDRESLGSLFQCPISDVSYPRLKPWASGEAPSASCPREARAPRVSVHIARCLLACKSGLKHTKRCICTRHNRTASPALKPHQQRIISS